MIWIFILCWYLPFEKGWKTLKTKMQIVSGLTWNFFVISWFQRVFGDRSAFFLPKDKFFYPKDFSWDMKHGHINFISSSHDKDLPDKKIRWGGSPSFAQGDRIFNVFEDLYGFEDKLTGFFLIFSSRLLACWGTFNIWSCLASKLQSKSRRKGIAAWLLGTCEMSLLQPWYLQVVVQSPWK